MKILSPAFFIMLLLVTSLSELLAQTASKSTPEQYLRSLFYSGDFHVAGRDAPALATKPGASLETRAWFVGNMRLKKFEALAVLDSMQKDAPLDAWTLAARTFSTTDPDYSIMLCEKAIAKDNREDILTLCSAGVANSVWSPGGAVSANAFLERHQQRFEASAQGLATKANLLSVIYRTKDGKRYTDEVTALYDRALEMDSKNLSAMIGKFNDLAARRQFKDATAFITPKLPEIDSQILHYKYWDVVSKREDLSKEEKARLIESDIRLLLERAELVDYFVEQVGFTLRGLSEERAEVFIDLIIQKYPDSTSAKMALVLRAVAKLGTELNIEKVTTEVRHEVAGNLIEFIKLSGRRSEAAEGLAAYVLKGFLAQEKDTDPEQLLAAAKALSIKNAVVVINALATRKSHLPELEQIALQGVEEILRETKAKDLVGHYEILAGSLSFEMAWKDVAQCYDALGFVYLQQGRLNEAEAKLKTAEKLADSQIGSKAGSSFLNTFPDILVHLGQLYTAKGEFQSSEKYLERALAARFDFSVEHPAIEAYRQLYLKQNKGNKLGLEKYMAVVYDKDAVRRKGLILKERIAESKPIPAFNLTGLDGKNYSSEELKGKFVVINFWGTWCGPCVKEMPELQKFYEKYKNHQDVVILTIDRNDTTESIKQFLALKKYTMPVLLEGDYLNQADVRGYPTTWFLDRDGKKVFEKTGGSTLLLEEFSWRVEAMIESSAKADKSATVKP